MRYLAECEGRTWEIDVAGEAGARALVSNGERLPAEIVPGSGAVRRCRIGSRALTFGCRVDGDEIHVVLDGFDYVVRLTDARLARLAAAGASAGAKPRAPELRAPIPGRVVRVLVKPGDVVERHQHVMTLDAMKLENEIAALQAGTIVAVLVEPGQTVEKDQPLVRFES